MIDARAVFISHGGGPLPLLGDPAHQPLVDELTRLAQQLKRPKAIVVVSAHWEANPIAITSAAKPSLIYDYYGFDPKAYDIQYPASGDPELANWLHQRIQAAGLEVQLDAQRGWDHGTFVPMALMYPQADILIVQLSLHPSLSPELHIRLGQALAELHQQQVLVLGSGFSFHNMRAFFNADEQTDQANQQFEAWLQTTLGDPMDESQRQQQLMHWHQAPGGPLSHPREEHLLPLHLCYGVANQAYQGRSEIRLLNKTASFYWW